MQRATSPNRALPATARQQAQARERLQHSVANWTAATRAIVEQQNVTQKAGREAARNAAWVRDGVGVDGLDPLAGGQWDAAAIETSGADASGRHPVKIAQNRSRAILDWQSFHVGRNTDLQFVQQSTDVVLNRVKGDTRPSQIQGSIKADGTVLVVNQNGVIFTGSSQVNVRNFVAAAANYSLTDEGFRGADGPGLYNGSTATFRDALGSIEVQAGAQLSTKATRDLSSIEGGGYVLLTGKSVQNAGTIHTPRGQAVLAAGDSFIIRKGQGNPENLTSTTRGNEVTANGQGAVSNTGLIQSPQGDITLTANHIDQAGVLAASTSVGARGTIHLTATGTNGQIRLAQGSVSAILADASEGSALDSQRDALLAPAVDGTANTVVPGDTYRRDLSLVRVVSSGSVDFEGGSLTLATGGQVAVEAGQRTLVRSGAVIDVSGAFGVPVAMEANSIQVSIQGNEQRDAPVNRESGNLNSSNVWVDARELIHVPADYDPETNPNGYKTDRWYTKGGLLEVGGYLGTQGHGIGEWLAQGGSVIFTGQDVVTQAGSQINVSGGTLDVQSGYVRQSWLMGGDGRLYEVSRAPADVLYQPGVYLGYEVTSERWGHTRLFRNPLLAPTRRWEPGYTVGRDAGTLVIGTKSAVLEGDVVGDTYQGGRQTQLSQPGLDSYDQRHWNVANAGQFVVGRYVPYYVKNGAGGGILQYGLTADTNSLEEVVFGKVDNLIAGTLAFDTELPADRQGKLYLDTDTLNGFSLGRIKVAASKRIAVDDALAVGHGGEITLYGPQIDINADVTSRGGVIQLGNVLYQVNANARQEDTPLAAQPGTTAALNVAADVKIDASGLWSNLRLDPANLANLPYLNGGSVSLRSTGAIQLATGSIIDVNGGAVSLAGRNAYQGGRGGDLLLEASHGGGTHSFVLDGTLQGYGMTGGGTLDVRAHRMQLGGSAAGETGALVMDLGLLHSGFSEYLLTGHQGLLVADDARVDVFMPILRPRDDAQEMATGTSLVNVLDVWTAPLHQENPVEGVLTQRAGASLTLHAGSERSSGADMEIVKAIVGKRASVRVDPGQSIEIRSVGQLTIDGRLEAAGGRIELGSILTAANSGGVQKEASGHGRSIWIGEQAVLDVAGRAFTQDAAGRILRNRAGERYGIVQAGGDIIIGGAFDHGLGEVRRMNPVTQSNSADSLFVVVREGALLDASGTTAVLDLPGKEGTPVASHGGHISLASSNGLYVDGILRAVSGGQGAAGGALTMVLDTPFYQRTSATDRVRRLRELVLSQQGSGSGFSAGNTPEGVAASLVYGHGGIGADQVQAGGFDSLTLAVDGALSADGDMALSLGQSLSLYARTVALTERASAASQVRLAAPYMRLAGYGGETNKDSYIHPTLLGGSTDMSARSPGGSLLLDAGQVLELRGIFNSGAFGGAGASQGLPLAEDRRGFGTVALRSRGDLRLMGGEFYTSGDMLLAGARIYPTTGAVATVYAGWQRGGSLDKTRSLTLSGTSVAGARAPESVFGKLTLQAPVINQGGSLYAPMGEITLGVAGVEQVNLLPGSLTSVSAKGLVMPYGGTADGVIWRYGDDELALKGLGSLDAGVVRLTGPMVSVSDGAVIDLSGGGTLVGAGFVSGRGGSTDARYTPLMQVGRGGFVIPDRGAHQIYAIVPGYVGNVAPTSEPGTSAGVHGQRITIDQGIPGLPAGTYTLLPSTYALLPGAFRVEVSDAGMRSLGKPMPMRNGSWSIVGHKEIAGTAIRDTLASRLVLTPADVLRKYSQYNETTYADFVKADAATLGVARAMIEADAKSLLLNFTPRVASQNEVNFSFQGTLLAQAGEGGYGSTVAVLANSPTSTIEILGDGTTPSAAYPIAMRASDLSRMGANRIVIGGLPRVEYGQGGNIVRLDGVIDTVNISPVASVAVRSGAVLQAPEVMLITRGAANARGIEIEQGAVINTLGQGQAAYGSDQGFIFHPGSSSVVSVSNARQQWLAPEAGGSATQPGPVRIGTCPSGDCTGTTALYSEGSISFVTNKVFDLDDAVRYGTRHLSLAVGAFNIGGNAALSEAAARGGIADGLTLNQSVMSRLLQGDTSVGAPALETLELIAGQSVNFFDTVTLSTLDASGRSLLANLMLTTPAIYGYGEAEAVAKFQTGHLIWNGTANAPGAVVTGGAGTGSGVLQVEAERITFGYGDYGQPDGVSQLGRLALGFSEVNLHASERVTSNNLGKLDVYQRKDGPYVPGEGQRYSGGNLNIFTPLMTGESGSVNLMTAGGAITLSGSGMRSASPISTLGAELSLVAGSSVTLDTALVLPSGKLSVQSQGDIQLKDAATLDLSGRAVRYFNDGDATQYSWGGDIKLESLSGSIRQSHNSLIDFSAKHNQAGKLTLIALGDGAGTVDLQGVLLGSATGYYAAGGTYVPYLGGGISVHAQNLGGELTESFGALNRRLNQGEVFGQRTFQFKQQADLTIGNDAFSQDGNAPLLKATQIEVSLDRGRLTISGVVDASGERVGSIRLAGKNGLTVEAGAVLDASGTMLRLDSYGKIIEAPNRAFVELSSGDGVLTLAERAVIDLRYGKRDVRMAANPALHDGRLLGLLELNAPRVDSDGNANTAAAATHGDVAIDVRDAVEVLGAKSIVLNAVHRYADAPDGTDQTVSGKPYQVINQTYLNGIHGDSRDFIAEALDNDNLLSLKLAGLNDARYRDVFHVRPGVEIVSRTPDGDLVIGGDLDLSGYRYASLNPVTQKTAVAGSGEPGALVIRAGGDLSIFGSVNDGFVTPPDTPDDNGWILTPGVQGYGGDVVVPGAGVSLAAGTTFPAGKTLNYAIPIQAVTLPAGTELPVAAKLAGPLTLPAGTVVRADILNASGAVEYAAGSILGASVTVPANWTLGAGTVLPAVAQMAAMEWPSGVRLPAQVTLANNLGLKVGALIPSMTNVKLVGNAISVPLRPAGGGRMGRNWAIAQMLPEGSLSWGLRLVAGADIDAADSRMMRPQSEGRMVLADTHYSLFGKRDVTVIPGTPAQPGGKWFWTELGAELFATEPNTQVAAGEEDFCMEPDMCFRVQYVWDELGAELFGGEVGKPVPASELDFCLEPDMCVSLGDPIPGTPDRTTFGNVVQWLPAGQSFSVLRTGTGNLDLLAADDMAMHSLYGIYTAGTNAASSAGAEAANFNLARGKASDGTFLGTSRSGDNLPDDALPFGPEYERLVSGAVGSTYAAWYPDHGGNVLLKVGGNLTGDVQGTYMTTYTGEDLRVQRSGVDTGNWLWRQGSGNTAGVNPIATSWWINFGTYVPGSSVPTTIADAYGLNAENRAAAAAIPELVGFQGIGTLGGGNLTVDVAGDAGMLNRRGSSAHREGRQRSEALMLAVGSTGRVLASGDILLTGGGDLNLRVGGGINPGLAARANPPAGTSASADYRLQNLDITGALTNLRGDLRTQAGDMGGVALKYYNGRSANATDERDVRALLPYSSSLGAATGGPVLMLGDATATFLTRGDAVLGGSGDPGRAALPVSLPYTTSGGSVQDSGAYSWFSLWTDNTAIKVFSAGGDVTPSVQLADVANNGVSREGKNYSATDGRFVWPSQLSVVAADGSVYLGKSALGGATATEHNAAYSLLLAPSRNSNLQILAGDSIYAGGYVTSLSGADVSVIPTPLRPAFMVFTGTGATTTTHNLAADAIRPTPATLPLFSFGPNTASTLGYDGLDIAPVRLYANQGDIIGLGSGQVITFPTTGVRAGQVWYEGAGPVWMRAGRDIVRSGERIGELQLLQGLGSTPGGTGGNASGAGNLIVHTRASDVSIIEAGRNIWYSSFQIAGPGLLEVSAGRDLILAGEQGNSMIRSIGPTVAADARPGAGVAVQAGVGAQGAGLLYRNFLDHYLSREGVEGTGHRGLADPDKPLAEQLGTVPRTYDRLSLEDWLRSEYGYRGESVDGSPESYLANLQVRYAAENPDSKTILREVYEKEAASDIYLVNWLTRRYGAGTSGWRFKDPATGQLSSSETFDVATMDSIAWFNRLPAEQQRVFARQIYFAELRSAGREYNNALGPRQGNYGRGRNAIASLLYAPILDSQNRPLPVWDGQGEFALNIGGEPNYKPYPYQGNVLAYLNAGVHTDVGGDIQVLTPGGAQTYGVEGEAPDSTAGLITRQGGHIQMFSLGSILLGQSRVMTTFGGDIFAWSAQGDINAGRGSKTTLVYTPPRRVYDAFGNVSISPDLPSTGAGIATLAPIPEVPPGDLDLVAPLGTIDAGEAGIRFSGNANFAALQVVNAANIVGQGDVAGVPVIAAVNVGALTSASSAAASAATTAQETMARARAESQRSLPSIISVQILGFGEEGATQGSSPPAPNVQAPRQPVSYNPSSTVQLLGNGPLTNAQRAQLTEKEQANAL